MISEIESELLQEETTEIPSSLIGEKIIKKLINLDSIAYIRFASVYKNFNDILSFKQEIQKLKEEKPKYTITQIKKRDNSIALFNQERITTAIYKASKAINKADKAEAKRLSNIVLKILEDNFKDKIPAVEEIQDIVEKTLIDEGHSEIAKAYILYREQHRRLREIKDLLNFNEIIEDYLTQEDWHVKENSNMNYSLQGLNNHITTKIVSKYWLNKLYPEKIRQAYDNGDLHIHDLGSLSAYCVGWDLRGLLLKGFRGVSGKIEANPPKHYYSALGQIINFLYTLQGECYSEDTQVLTESGWKYFYEVRKTDKIFTLNKEGEIELKLPTNFFEFDYDGALYNFKSKKIDLLVTPNHNMLVKQYCPGKEEYSTKFVKAKDFNPHTHLIPKQSFWKGKEEEYFILQGIEIKQYHNFSKKYENIQIEPKKILMNIWLKFLGFYIAEGNAYLRKRNRINGKPYHEYLIRIFQNEGKKCEEFENTLKELPFNYIKKIKKKEVIQSVNLLPNIQYINTQTSFNEAQQIIPTCLIQQYPKESLTISNQLQNKVVFEIRNKQLYEYLKQFGKSGDKYIPQGIKNLSRFQLRILFDWMMKGDGYIGNGNIEYCTKSKKLADDVQEIILKLGWTSNIYKRIKKEFSWYKVSISKTKHFKFSSKENIKKINYKGKVYCLEVSNHTLYVRRNGRACWCGNSAGAMALSNFDTYIAPFIKYDSLNYKEVKQGVQEFLYNMNVPTRTGFQSPFTNITLDLKVPEFMKKENVIIGGKLMKETYSEFQKEMDMFNKAFAEVMIEGDAKGRVFTFPIPTYNITKNFDWDNPNYEPIWEMTAKLGIPYFSNFINSDMKPEDVKSMCCRLRIDKRELDKRGGGLFGANPLTGSIGVVTINMARLGYLSKTESQFFQKLEYLMDISKESLEIKRKLLESFTESDLYPYSKFYLQEIKQAYGKYWKNHFSTIGLNGMNECCLNFLKKDISTKEGIKFTLKVLDFMRNKLSDYQEETGNIYNLEATPAEGSSYSLALKDKKQYPDIIAANEPLIKEQNAEPYYTNSSQLPVGYTDDIFEALELQDELQSKYTGGTVVHGFIGEKMPSAQATKELVKKIAYNFKLPYYTLTPTFSICPKKHGYIPGEHEYCPKCDAELGYLKKEVIINEGRTN